jgi:hypothetical protein
MIAGFIVSLYRYGEDFGEDSFTQTVERPRNLKLACQRIKGIDDKASVLERKSVLPYPLNIYERTPCMKVIDGATQDTGALKCMWS